MSIAALLASSAAATGADAGIIDQDVKALMVAFDGIGKCTDLVQRGEVGKIGGCIAAFIANAGNHLVGPRLVAAVDQHLGTHLRQSVGNPPTLG